MKVICDDCKHYCDNDCHVSFSEGERHVAEHHFAELGAAQTIAYETNSDWRDFAEICPSYEEPK